MAGPSKAAGLIWVVAALAAIFLLTRRAKGEPPPAGGPATPGGGIGTVTVAQQASMGSHLIVKRAGDTAVAVINWTASTKDDKGNPINWPYAVAYMFQNVFNSAQSPIKFFRLGPLPNGAYTFRGSQLLDASFPPGSYHMLGQIFADTSSPAGMPNGDATSYGAGVNLAFLWHTNAMRVI